MTGKKLTRAQLLKVIGECQTLFGRAKSTYHNDRQPDRARAMDRVTNEGFALCLKALENEKPQ